MEQEVVYEGGGGGQFGSLRVLFGQFWQYGGSVGLHRPSLRSIKQLRGPVGAMSSNLTTISTQLRALHLIYDTLFWAFHTETASGQCHDVI